VAAGDREKAVVALLLGIVEMSPEDIEFLRAIDPTGIGVPSVDCTRNWSSEDCPSFG
jgi:hypothetical protein